jgi:hypothetical protein
MRSKKDRTPWVPVYDVDFKTLGLSDLGVAEAGKSIDGKTWTLENGSAMLDDLILNPNDPTEEGLWWDFSAVNSTYSTTADTMPQLQIALSEFIAGFTGGERLRIWCKVNVSDADANTEALGIGIRTGVGTRSLGCSIGHQAAARGFRWWRHDGGAVTSDDAATATSNVMVMSYHGADVDFYHGLHAGSGWPKFADLTTAAGMHASVDLAPTDSFAAFGSGTELFIWGQTGNVSDNFEAFHTQLRIDRALV